MKKAVLYFGIITILSLSVSCKKKLSGQNLDTVGTWSNGDDTVLKIESNGHGIYNFKGGGVTKKIDGRVLFDGDEMTFKALGFKESFHIDKRPYQQGGQTKMLLSGDEYIQQ